MNAIEEIQHDTKIKLDAAKVLIETANSNAMNTRGEAALAKSQLSIATARFARDKDAATARIAALETENRELRAHAERQQRGLHWKRKAEEVA